MSETLSNSGFPHSEWNHQGFLSIDKVALIWDVPRILSELEKSKFFYGKLNRIMQDASRQMKCSELFEFNVQYSDSMCSWGRGLASETGSLFRMEFNPNRIKWAELIPVLRLLGKFTSLLWGRISRIDTAIDYKASLNPLMFHDKFKRKGSIFYGLNGVQTVYLGMRSSDVQIRIYDKSLEQREQFDITGDESWWRVEAEIKSTTNILEEIKNPFENLYYSELNGKTVIPSERYLIKFFWAFAEKYGIDLALKEMPKATRSRFKQNIIESKSIERPAIVFDREFRAKKQSLESNLVAYATA